MDTNMLRWYGAACIAAAQVFACQATSPVDGAENQVVAPGAISTEASRVYIFVGKTGLGHEHAVIGKLKSGELHLGATQNAGQLVFDMTSFTADTAEARQALGLSGTTEASTQQQVNTNMRGTAVLNTAKFPTAEFRIDSAMARGMNSEGEPQYELKGELTLHGVARPLTLAAHIPASRNGYHRVRCAFRLLQTDYGMIPFRKALGAVGVTDELRVYGDVWVSSETPIATHSSAAPRR
jgi:polyisoprenoid-binding protein YceI